MHIVQVELFQFPYKAYGGTQRDVYWLADEFTKQGHRVSLVCSPGSYHRNEKVNIITATADDNIDDLLPADTDVVHFHNGDARSERFPYLCTLHGNTTDTARLDKEHVIGISQNHIKRHELLYYVYNGIPENDELFFNETPDDYYLFFSKVSRSLKGAHTAMSVARKTGIHLKVGGGTRFDLRKRWRGVWDSFFCSAEFYGEVAGIEKSKLFANAKALLFPIEWEEPFGLVLVESMLSGTPVIGFNRGSVPEIIQSKGGFVVNDEQEMIEAIDKVSMIDRRQCYEYALQNFSITKCAQEYLKQFERVIKLKETSDGKN